VCNFADDFLFGSDTLKDAYGRFLHAVKMAAKLGMTLTLVAICGTDATAYVQNGPFEWIHQGKPFPLTGSMKVLGACIHFKTGSGCAQRKCQTCENIEAGKYCNTCQTEALDKIAGLGLPTLDRVQICNNRFLSSARYGIYTCLQRQRAWESLGIRVRHVLGGPGNGGYIHAAVLPAKAGGLGIECTAEFLSVEVVGLLERSLSRNEKLRKMASSLFEHGGDWPGPLKCALTTTRESSPAPITFTVHPDILGRQADRRSQDRPVQLEIVSVVGGEDRVTVLLIARSMGAISRYHHTYEERKGPKEQKAWSVRKQAVVLVRLLARIVEEEQRSAKYVTFHKSFSRAIPQEVSVKAVVENYVKPKLLDMVESILQRYKDDRGNIFREERVYTSVLARTRIALLTDEDSPPPVRCPKGVGDLIRDPPVLSYICVAPRKYICNRSDRGPHTWHPA